MTTETQTNGSATEASPETFTISVTQDDIENGERKEGRTCPVGLAFRKAGLFYESIGYCYVYPFGLSASHGLLIDKLKAARALPREVTKFLHDFDDGKAVEPFTFTWIL